MNVNPGGLQEMLDSIDYFPRSNLRALLDTGPQQEADLEQLTVTRNARDAAIAAANWECASEHARQLFALARQYILNYFPTEQKYQTYNELDSFS